MVTPDGSRLYAKLAEVMSAVGHVDKRGENKQQGYKYVTESDLADAVRDQLAERGVMLFTSVLSCDLTPIESKQGGKGFLASVLTRHEFVDGETGEQHSFLMRGSGTDYPGDKAVYKALTGAVKYALMKTFLIPTGDDPEADGEVGKRKSTPKAGGTGITEPQLKKLSVLASKRGYDDTARHQFAASFLKREVKSFKDLSKGEASQIIEAWSTKPGPQESGSDPTQSPSRDESSPTGSPDPGTGGAPPDSGKPTGAQKAKANQVFGSPGAVVVAARKRWPDVTKFEDLSGDQLEELNATKGRDE